MRKQWPCSKCGFACSSTWRSVNPTKPVVCNSCKSKANSSKLVAGDSWKQAVAPNNNVDTTHPMSSDPNPSTTLLIKESIPSPNVDPGRFVFGASRTDTVQVDQQEPNSKEKERPPSSLFESYIHEEIKEDDTKKLALDEAQEPSFWNHDNVQKKKRTKLPQFTPSPVERLSHHLYNISKELEITNNKFANEEENPKYDDLFIYEKCKFIPENEIGLGAMLLPMPTPSKETGEPGSSAEAKEVIKLESPEDVKPELPTKDNEASCSLVDNPKMSSAKVVRGEGSPLYHMNSKPMAYKPLGEIYSHVTTLEEKSAVVVKTRGRPPKGTGLEYSEVPRNSDEIPQLDSSSLVDVPSTCSFNENTNFLCTQACEVEILVTDVEKMTTLSMLEEEIDCPLMILLDTTDSSGNTL